jgi:hypothetical protein
VAESVKSGIVQLGRHRAVSLSPHKQWELTDELEKKVDQLLMLLKGMESHK